MLEILIVDGVPLKFELRFTRSLKMTPYSIDHIRLSITLPLCSRTLKMAPFETSKALVRFLVLILLQFFSRFWYIQRQRMAWHWNMDVPVGILPYRLAWKTRMVWLPDGEQELSYRQQLARQLRTNYAEGIYMHKYYTVTLKSRLSVTQGHWKQNHWINHTRLSSSLVIWRWI